MRLVSQSVVELLKNQGDEVLTTAQNKDKIIPDFILDASDFNAVDKVFEQAGSIDGVVNCAGSLLLKSAHVTSFDEFQKTINASLTTSFAIVRAAGKSDNDARRLCGTYCLCSSFNRPC